MEDNGSKSTTTQRIKTDITYATTYYNHLIASNRIYPSVHGYYADTGELITPDTDADVQTILIAYLSRTRR